MNDELIFYANETVKDCVAKAERVYQRIFQPPTIRFDLRGTSAGQALYFQNTIRINAQLFRENVDAFLKRTIPHEVAHLISYAVYGNDGLGHKARWKSVMRSLGVSDATRCHSYDAQPARKVARRFQYVCGCNGRIHNKLTAIKHNRMKRSLALSGRSRYLCKFCRVSLKPI
jgi:SprT protein